MAAAAKKAVETPQSVEEAPEVKEESREVAKAPEPVRQPQYLRDKHGRLGAERVEEVRKEAGIAEQTALLEATRTGVIKGS